MQQQNQIHHKRSVYLDDDSRHLLLAGSRNRCQFDMPLACCWLCLVR